MQIRRKFSASWYVTYSSSAVCTRWPCVLASKVDAFTSHLFANKVQVAPTQQSVGFKSLGQVGGYFSRSYRLLLFWANDFFVVTNATFWWYCPARQNVDFGRNSGYFPPKMVHYPCYKLKPFFPPHVYGFCPFSAYVPLIFGPFSAGPVLPGVLFSSFFSFFLLLYWFFKYIKYFTLNLDDWFTIVTHGKFLRCLLLDKRFPMNHRRLLFGNTGFRFSDPFD